MESEVELWQGIAVWNVSYVEREIGMAPGQLHVVTLYVKREMKSMSCKLVIISGRGNEFNVLSAGDVMRENVYMSVKLTGKWNYAWSVGHVEMEMRLMHV